MCGSQKVIDKFLVLGIKIQVKVKCLLRNSVLVCFQERANLFRTSPPSSKPKDMSGKGIGK